MASWTDKYLPFVSGLNLTKESLVDAQSFVVAENVDWDHSGAIKGRPSRAAPMEFTVSDLANNNVVSPTYGAPETFTAPGFTPRGLFRFRNFRQELPALACDGRLFVASTAGNVWVDRGRFACARVDRLFNYLSNQTTVQRLGVAPDFGAEPLTSFGFQGVRLLDGNFVPQQAVNTTITGTVPAGVYGNGTRSGTTTAVVEVVGTSLNFIYRTNGAASVTAVALASNAATPTSLLGGSNGDSACIAPSGDGTGFWVIYRTTTTDQYTVLRVSLTGSVTHSFSEVRTAFKGIWVDGLPNGGAAVAVTDGSNLYTRTLSSSAVQTWASTLAVTAKQVVIGATSNSGAWWATAGGEGGGFETITIGTATLTNGAAPVALKSYYSGDASKAGAALRWSIAHQPVTLNGRTYITLVSAILGTDSTSTGLTGTWITLDVTDLSANNQTPTLVARGGTEVTIPHGEAATAVPLTDGTGWTFATLDWSRVEAASANLTVGTLYSLGLNRVTLSGPRAAEVGPSTLLSGSIPHVVGSGQCYELGFPFLGGQPGLYAEATAGGAYVGISQTATIQAVWRFTDDDGVIHRSAPSPAVTVTGSSGNNTVSVYVTAPQLAGRPNIAIEIYGTVANPTANAPLYLLATYVPGSPWAQGIYSTSFGAGPDTTADELYTGGNVFENVHVPGDGGVAAVGRRVWLASADTVYASKELVPGEAPGFNDGGSLQVNLPAGVGRVLALEAIDDRLVILCEHGIFAVPDGGPDNTGVGLDFANPERLSDLGIAGPRSSCVTPRGIVLAVPLDATDYQRGGPWLLDRGLLTTSYLGEAVRDHLVPTAGFVPEVAYSPERDAVFMSYSISAGTGTILFDLRAGRYATWANQDTPNGSQRSITAIAGILWTLCDEPAPYSGLPGTDAAGDYAMTLTTDHIPVTGSAVGWGRVRSVTMVGTDNTGAFTLTLTALLDQETSVTSGAQTVAGPNDFGNWPTGRQAPEWRLPTQKCSTVQVTAIASPATAEWAALGLRVRPISDKAPPYQRF